LDHAQTLAAFGGEAFTHRIPRRGARTKQWHLPRSDEVDRLRTRAGFKS
jgi:hypothetical protein